MNHLSNILSNEERQILNMEFSCLDIKNRNLISCADLMKFMLKSEEYRMSSPNELLTSIKAQDTNGDNHISRDEYIQFKTQEKIQQEAENNKELLRHFSVIDFHGNGEISAGEIFSILDTIQDNSVILLKEAITLAAEISNCGKISFNHFKNAITATNRKTEKSIAAGKIRLLVLESRINRQGKKKRTKNPTIVEHEILKAHVLRMKKELINTSNGMFDRVYDCITSKYEDQHSVYECIQIFMDYIKIDDAKSFRTKLQRGGKVNVINSLLMEMPKVLQESTEYITLSNVMEVKETEEKDEEDKIFSNRTYHKIFLHYCLLGNTTNYRSLDQTNFLKFVKDFNRTNAICDADITNCYISIVKNESRLHDWEHFESIGSSHYSLFQGSQRKKLPKESSHALNSMNFSQWIEGTSLVLQKILHLSYVPAGKELQSLLSKYVVPYAKSAVIQNLGPEIAQPLVRKALKDRIWRLKQIFSHFGGHSMTKIDNDEVMSTDNFLSFARSFDIIRNRDSVSNKSDKITQISIQEALKEYYAAKLDVGCVDGRESDCINFHEFIRCIQRLALTLCQKQIVEIHLQKEQCSKQLSSFQYNRTNSQVHHFNLPSSLSSSLPINQKQLRSASPFQGRSMNEKEKLSLSSKLSAIYIPPIKKLPPKENSKCRKNKPQTCRNPKTFLINIGEQSKTSRSSRPATSRASEFSRPSTSRNKENGLNIPYLNKNRPLSLGGRPVTRIVQRAPGWYSEIPLEDTTQVPQISQWIRK